MDAIQIRCGDFYAELYLDRLGELPRSNFRKLLRLMRGAAPWENQAALDNLGAYLREQVKATKTAWEKASQDYVDGWKLVPNKRSRCLRAALKRAKGAYDTAVSLQTIYEKEIT